MKTKKRLNLPEENLPIKPLTLEELRESAKERVSLISKEFHDGFEFIKNYEKSVTFFGSSKFEETNKYYKQARSLAKKIVEELGYSVFTGGGPGIMEAANRGAYEAGGDSLGLAIKLPNEQALNPYITDHIEFYYFFSRKVCMTFSAEAFIFCPGGYGTLDEFFEVMTLIQTNKVAPTPAILIGSDFWKPLDEFIRNSLDKKYQTIDEGDNFLYTITDDESKVLDIIRKVPVKNGIRFTHPEF